MLFHTWWGLSCGNFAEESRHNLFVAARSGLGEFPKRIGIKHDDGAVLEPNPFARGPGAQLLVDALARHADHLADLLLGNGDRPVPVGNLIRLASEAESRYGYIL